MSKLYCHVDESGQDTEGVLFIVVAIVTREERDSLVETLERIERSSGKGRVKWIDTKSQFRLAYIRAVLSSPLFKGKLCYGEHHDSRDYYELTVQTTAEAITIQVQPGEKYKADVWVDGLPDSVRDRFAADLRAYGIRTGKVRGIEDERDALIRLADAVCGLLRDALDGKAEYMQLVKKATQEGYLIRVGE